MGDERLVVERVLALAVETVVLHGLFLVQRHGRVVVLLAADELDQLLHGVGPDDRVLSRELFGLWREVAALHQCAGHRVVRGHAAVAVEGLIVDLVVGGVVLQDVVLAPVAVRLVDDLLEERLALPLGQAVDEVEQVVECD
jgi:hypothetical protein